MTESEQRSNAATATTSFEVALAESQEDFHLRRQRGLCTWPGYGKDVVISYDCPNAAAPSGKPGAGRPKDNCEQRVGEYVHTARAASDERERLRKAQKAEARSAPADPVISPERPVTGGRRYIAGLLSATLEEMKASTAALTKAAAVLGEVAEAVPQVTAPGSAAAEIANLEDTHARAIGELTRRTELAEAECASAQRAADSLQLELEQAQGEAEQYRADTEAAEALAAAAEKQRDLAVKERDHEKDAAHRRVEQAQRDAQLEAKSMIEEAREQADRDVRVAEDRASAAEKSQAAAERDRDSAKEREKAAADESAERDRQLKALRAEHDAVVTALGQEKKDRALAEQAAETATVRADTLLAERDEARTLAGWEQQQAAEARSARAVAEQKAEAAERAAAADKARAEQADAARHEADRERAVALASEQAARREAVAAQSARQSMETEREAAMAEAARARAEAMEAMIAKEGSEARREAAEAARERIAGDLERANLAVTAAAENAARIEAAAAAAGQRHRAEIDALTARAQGADVVSVPPPRPTVR